MRNISLKYIVIAIALFSVLIAGSILLLVNLYLYDDNEYKITGLKLEQDGFSIKASWNEEECSGYRVFVMHGAERPVEINTDTNSCRITGVEIGSGYKVLVAAVTEDGTASGATKKKITTRKLDQEISGLDEAYEGFEGDILKLKAEAEGEISFVSGKEAVAEAGNDGTIELKKSGSTKLKIRASGNENYDSARAEVAITVYPDTLDKPDLTAEVKSDTEAELSWSTTDYATKYIISKKNPATGKFEKFKTAKRGESSVTLVRDHAVYNVKAVIESGDRKVESPSSDDAEVISAGEEAASYASSHDIKTLNSSNMDKVAMIQRQGAIDVPQSMCFNGSEYIVTYVNQGGTAGVLQAFDRDGNITRSRSMSFSFPGLLQELHTMKATINSTFQRATKYMFATAASRLKSSSERKRDIITLRT